MEVDDAAMPASSVSLGVKASTGAGTNNNNNGVARKNSGKVQELTDNGEANENKGKTEKRPRSHSMKRNSASVESDVPMKLRLTSDEDVSDLETYQYEESIGLKRKRFTLRRSGSKDFLLGFDEESGEAGFAKSDGNLDIAITDSPVASPRQAKRFKKSPASGKSSPKAQLNKTESPTKNPEGKGMKGHVVGDNEENGDIQHPPTPKSQTNSSQSISSDNASSKKSSSKSNYMKPFEKGWKRELVWRATMDSHKEKADVYFIAPNGKKLRSRNDIIPFLDGDLTIDHFNFLREPLGLGPEYETVRTAKPSGRTSVAAATLAAAPSPGNMGKRVSKPKGPKGASPPPEGWTPTRALKVNNAALHSSSSSKQNSSSTNSHPTTPSHRHHTASTHSNRESSSSKHSSSSSSNKSKKHYSTSSSEAPKSHDAKSSKSHGSSSSTSNATAGSGPSASHEPCTYNCSQANGKMPQLQCTKCLCLYHNECVGANNPPVGEYICEACQPKPNTAQNHTPTRTPVHTSQRSPASSSLKTGHSTRSPRPDGKLPQTIAVVKGKKQSNDIENDLRQIKEGIQHTNRTSTGSHTEAAVVAVERANKVFAANFFANVSYAYDALVCILKYLKIHERSRAASVCKLWHLAAKDTSLWQTVRMKNSKVCNWSGFAAALRRGETKHLDLRKMLISSGRSDEIWQAFSEHIGTVCSLEVIDLCRCSAGVVERLFESNQGLRILNAVAINDANLYLEKVGLMTELQELRLRTCEPCVLIGDLHSLHDLTKLEHLSLTSVRGLGAKGVKVLAKIPTLRSLELGECGDFESSFAEVVLPQLINLHRLRLENGTETACCTLQILEAVSQLKQLCQLELVNFDIKPGFDEKLCQCSNIRKLLIIPTYISQSATTNHIVLSAVQQISESLQVFTWGVTVELLRVTALYVDQCDDSMKKKKHHFDECIPVLKPVPGAPPAEEDETSKNSGASQTSSDVPQIEILPLDKVETILGENLPRTKFTIVKVPYVATSKQQLVE